MSLSLAVLVVASTEAAVRVSFEPTLLSEDPKPASAAAPTAAEGQARAMSMNALETKSPAMKHSWADIGLSPKPTQPSGLPAVDREQLARPPSNLLIENREQFSCGRIIPYDNGSRTGGNLVLL